MNNLLIIVLLLASTGCLIPLQRPEGGQGTGRSVNVAGRLVHEGKYQQGYEEYQRIARTAAGTPEGEEALYRAARVLLASRNPSKNYAAAVVELETYLLRYPAGKYADEAADLVAALDYSQKARVHALLENIDALEKKLEAAADARRQTEADRERTLKERDALLAERDALRAERDALGARLDAVVAERNELIKKQSALLRERGALMTDNGALKRKVEALKKDNEKLLAAKVKLEKNLRDMTAIDVKMEKERKKTK